MWGSQIGSDVKFFLNRQNKQQQERRRNEDPTGLDLSIWRERVSEDRRSRFGTVGMWNGFGHFKFEMSSRHMGKESGGNLLNVP